MINENHSAGPPGRQLRALRGRDGLIISRLISWHSAGDAALTECDFLTCGDASSSRSAEAWRPLAAYAKAPAMPVIGSVNNFEWLARFDRHCGRVIWEKFPDKNFLHSCDIIW
jgi:hypothetical protein